MKEKQLADNVSVCLSVRLFFSITMNIRILYSKFLLCIAKRMCNNCAIIFIFKSFEYDITNSFVVALVTGSNQLAAGRVVCKWIKILYNPR